MKKVLLILLFCIFHSWNGKAQADFYSLQPLGDRYIYDSEYFDDSRELQVYRSGVDAMLKSDSLLTIYVFDAQYPPTFNLFCSTFELLYPGVPCIIVGISNPNRQSELTPPYTDEESVKGYDDPGKGDSLLLSLEKEIIPFIKSRYNTSSRNILVGHSLGGTFVTYALLSNPGLFQCILSVSPNYMYSKKMMIDKLSEFTKEYKGNNQLYMYLASGKKDKIEESFKPATEEAIKILSTCPKIVLNYDSLNIEKHSHTVFEGYYRGLLGLKNYINKE